MWVDRLAEDELGKVGAWCGRGGRVEKEFVG